MYELQLRVGLPSVPLYCVSWRTKAFQSGVQKLFSFCRNSYAVSVGLVSSAALVTVCVDACPLR